MPEVIVEGLAAVTRSLEVIAAAALVLGFIIATWRWFLEILRKGSLPAMEAYRHALGRVVGIGLEVLVAASIIKTITFELSADAMIQLGLILAIRTTLGWATSLEMTGRWPWQSAQPGG